MIRVEGVAGLVLAAGAGRRYGMPKALVEHRGRLLVERAVDNLAACPYTVVVLGASADEVRARAHLSGATVIVNSRWSTGMASSLRLGLTALFFTAARAAVVVLVDTPGVTATAVRRVAAGADPMSLVVATYHGVPGHPVLLGRDHWASIDAQVTYDIGAREYLRRHAAMVRLVPCEDIADGEDLDYYPEPTDQPGVG